MSVLLLMWFRQEGDGGLEEEDIMPFFDSIQSTVDFTVDAAKRPFSPFSFIPHQFFFFFFFCSSEREFEIKRRKSLSGT